MVVWRRENLRVNLYFASSLVKNLDIVPMMLKEAIVATAID